MQIANVIGIVTVIVIVATAFVMNVVQRHMINMQNDFISVRRNCGKNGRPR